MARRHIYLSFLICCSICAQASLIEAGRFNGWRRDSVNYFQGDDDDVTPEQKQKYQVCLASCSPGPAPTLQPSPSPSLACGKGASSPKSLRVIGGRNVKPGEFPYNVRVGVNLGRGDDSWRICGGVIIDDFNILSSAHCFQSCKGSREVEPKHVRVSIGEHSTSVKGDGEKILLISRLTVHPNFEPCRQIPSQDDLAILRTSERMNLELTGNGYGSVNAICVPKSNTDYTAGHNAILTGWGKTGASGAAQHVLQVAKLEIGDVDKCQMSWRSEIEINPRTHICAHKPGGQQGPCSGDSGGPLAALNGYGTYDLVGVLSFAGSNCNNSRPAVYTRVSQYLSWIESNRSS